jgi:hypothetical protein
MKPIWMWLLMILLLHSLERLWVHREDVIDLLGLGPAYIPRPIDLTEENWWKPLPHENVSLELRTKRAHEDSDKFYDPKRFGKDYSEKIRKHNYIAKYLTATRRGDPQYVKVMLLIARRGYGILEWDATCNVILNHQIRFPVRRRMEKEYSKNTGWDDEILFETEQGYEFWAERLAGIFGMIDHEFFRELLAVELGIRHREPILGFPGRDLEIGDRFFTDEDWITPEIRAAQATYQGRSRSDWSHASRGYYAQFLRKSRLRGYGREIPEYRHIIQNLVDVGMIARGDLEGVEIIDGPFGGNLELEP